MPPRLNKRQQRELEELEALSGSLGKDLKVDSAEEEEEEEFVPAPKKGGFSSLLMNDMGDEEESEEDVGAGKKAKKKSKKKKKKPAAAASSAATPSQPSPSPAPTPSSITTPAQAPTPEPSMSKTERKAIKKARAKEKQREAEEDEVDKALKELGVPIPKITSTTTSSSSLPTLPTLLSVSLPHLDADAELRKFFGAKVVQSSAGFDPNTNYNRRQKAALKAQQATMKSNLTRPKAGWWARGREGLSLRMLSSEEVGERRRRRGWEGERGWGEDGEKWWTVEYSRKYRAFTKRFMDTVLSGDPQGFWDLISALPWHADTLLQLSEVYRHREEHAPSSDFLDRALFTYERALVGAFTFTTGLNRLDFDRVENRPFYLAVVRVVVDLNRRGCPRTSFEFAKLLYSLDPWDDPHGALLHLEMVAIRAGMGGWVGEVWDLFEAKRKEREGNDGEKEKRGDNGKGGWGILGGKTEGEGKGGERMDPSLLPGWAYSRALGMWIEEEGKGKDHTPSTNALKSAILDFPSIVPLLADKIEASIPGHVRALRECRVETDGMGLKESESILHLLSHLYAQRASGIWKVPAHVAWFTSTVSSAISPTTTSLPPTLRLKRMLKMYDSSEVLQYSVYRHVMVLETTYRRLFSYIPRSVLQQKSLSCDPLPPPTSLSSYDSSFFSDLSPSDVAPRRTRRQRDQENRHLAQMVPDAAVREQLRAFFEGNPEMEARFPGGILQFVQALGRLPPEVVEDLMLIGAAGGAGGGGGLGGLAGLAGLFGDGFADGGGAGGLLGDMGGGGGGMPGAFEFGFADGFAAGRAGQEQGEGDGLDGEEDGEEGDGDMPGAIAGARRVYIQGDRVVDVDDVDDFDDEDVDEDEDEDEEEEDLSPMPRAIRNILGRFFGRGRQEESSEESGEGEEEGEDGDELGVD